MPIGRINIEVSIERHGVREWCVDLNLRAGGSSMDRLPWMRETSRSGMTKWRSTDLRTNDDIDPLVGRGRYSLRHYMMDQVRDEGFESQRVAENWQDVTKVYTQEISEWGAIPECRFTLRTFFRKSRWIWKKDLMYSTSDIFLVLEGDSLGWDKRGPS